ncbi:S8 family serine peptidase [bacterium]|nr:S8 family serine peptidase [bacterium]
MTKYFIKQPEALIIFLLLTVFFSASVFAINRTEPIVVYDDGEEIELVTPPVSMESKLNEIERSSINTNEINIWVFFTDKGIFTKENYIDKKSETWYNLSERNMIRRRRLGYDKVNFTDIPIPGSYIEEITGQGANLRYSSRWLNAATFEIDPSILRDIADLPFVRDIRSVKVSRQILDKPQRKVKKYKEGYDDSNVYGGSYYQLSIMGVPELHQANLHGEGVLIGIFDTGFLTSHNAFDSINIIYTWDYIQGDTVVDNEEGDAYNQHNHGTNTLGTLAGFFEGELVGPAYKADIAIFKTEQVDAETVWQEEDRWVRAIEKAESLGVDIISSSLGYGTSDGDDGYTYMDMDGNTALTTIAADIAASKNVLVVTAAGNERRNFWHYIIAPGDGDSVLTAGAMDSAGTYAAFSSPGPTYDGRIKPDLSALGMNVVCASPEDTNAITRSNGTSFATPLLAGTAALVLQHSFSSDTLTAMELLDTLKSTADQWYEPDNDFGWGRPHCLLATGNAGGVYGIVKDASNGLPMEEVAIHFHSDTLYGQKYTDERGRFLIPVENPGLYTFCFSMPGYSPATRTVTVTRNEKVEFHIDMAVPVDEKIFIYPNPFSDSLVVGVYPDSVDTIPQDDLSMWVWNAAGQLVFEKHVDIQYVNPYIWRTKTGSGRKLGSGIYIIYAEYNKFTRKEKIALIR